MWFLRKNAGNDCIGIQNDGYDACVGGGDRQKMFTDGKYHSFVFAIGADGTGHTYVDANQVGSGI